MLSLLALFISNETLRPIALLASSTLISEDLACILAGQLIARGSISAPVGIAGCFLGIFLGDFGLWLLGRWVVRRFIAWPWAVRLVEKARVRKIASFPGDRLGVIVSAARFIPGMRLPTYIALGAVGVEGAPFALWTFLAASIWTPLVVLLVARFGDAVVRPLQAYFSASWIVLIPAVLIGLLIIRLLTSCLTELGRAKLITTISRIWRWEFWPAWLFYIPLIPWIAWLSLRHRGFMTITAANPGIPNGGFVGESKYQILSSLASEHVSRTVLIRDGNQTIPFTLPLILKPDVGQRGAGVKLVRSLRDAIEYLRISRGDIIAQKYHPGPYEAGVFYYRFPDESSGHILSITDKVFSQVIGDGISTLEQLIWRHPRYRMQAQLFLARHADHAQRVLGCGETFQLAMVGNHCQGTMFKDGSHQITQALEQKIDEIAKTFEGFYFGRFDVRYSNVDQFKAGEDLVIIELNGVTSESTNLYDPTWSLLRAYRLLFRQWSILFQIGAANRMRGQTPGSYSSLFREIFTFLRN
jgi:membrane protein DedA with SNARE-associated domain